MARRRDVFITCIFALHVVLGADIPHMSPAVSRVDPSGCRSLMDLYIVIDGSDSISKDDFITLQKAIAGFVPHIDVGPYKARIGMLVYSSNVPMPSEHPFSDNADYLVNAAITLQHPRDGTNTAIGLNHMRKMFKNFGRADVPWVCVTITDGISKDPVATATEAKLAEKMGISMFALGVGQLIDVTELLTIASTEKQVMKLDNFNQLTGILTSMMTTICPCPIPPTVNLAKCNDGPRAIGTVRTFQCLDGYLQRGNPSITCRSDFTWSPLSLDFECVPCGPTPEIQHGYCNGGLDTIGALRMMACNDGYVAEGNPEIQCLPNGKWSMPQFSCRPCDPTPDIKYGYCNGGLDTIGALRMMACNDGYVAEGNPEIQCLPNGQWSMPQFSCRPCDPTPEIKYGYCNGGLDTIGALRMMACNDGYLAEGNPEIQCLPNGQWSMPQFSCRPCDPTPEIQYGYCNGGLDTIGALRMMACNDGYLAEGNPEIQCLLNGQWSMPQFSCRPCDPTPEIKYGYCNGGLDTIGALRMMACNDGYIAEGNPEIQCLPNGQWSMPQFSCRPCDPTPEIQYGYCNGGLDTIGALRMMACNDGYLAEGNPEIQCLPNGQWSMPQFSCRPCDPTPEIKYGYCNGGLDTIGAMRMMACNDGYVAEGNPEIQCLPNGQWSMPQFSCRPCDPTPDIKYGYCNGGLDTIGALRMMACNDGYIAEGNPEIQCLTNGQWSMPQFSCRPCDPTPEIKYGYCNGGLDTIGALRMMACNDGYVAEGNPEIQCLPNGQWSMPQFSCRPCDPTPEIKYGYCNGGLDTIGALRMMACNDGYVAEGNPEIQCLPSGQWSMPQFSCRPCDPTPEIKYGYCNGGLDTIGALRMMACNDGYVAEGNPEIQCLPSGQWSMPQFSCRPCDPTPEIKYGYCNGGLDTIGALRMMACNDGYVAEGNPEIQCLPNGQWSMPQFSCRPCDPTPDIKYGYCNGGLDTIGALRMMACNDGYIAEGNPEIQCLPNGQWSMPQFSCRPCDPTPEIQYGYCNGGLDTIGALRMMACNDGYLAEGNPEIQCLPNGKWSMPQFSCRPCDPTPEIKYGYCNGGLDTIGALRMMACNDGYLAEGNPEIQCLPNGQWSMPQFSCRPCDPTPEIQYGYCNGGLDTIGALRMMACNDGYLAEGNPEIQCLPNGKWSMPQFSCRPCDPTPEIKYGYCNGGLDTIGALRMMACNEGYLAEGNPEIQCLPNGQWSMPQFSCSPCKDTHIVPNAECGSGDSIIGSRREYKCYAGYVQVGTPFTECLPNAQWSKPSFTCSDCGAPPKVYNAYTKLGPSLIGSVRDYQCEAGYKMYGSGQLTCLPNGQWEVPQFSCNVITTTTTTTPAPIPSDPSVCDACRMINGVGYNRHPFDCNQYVQCFVGNRGMEPVYRRCPFGQFWDQDDLTCRPSHLCKCPYDKCADPSLRGYRHSDSQDCCSYWKCQNGKSYGECCGSMTSFSNMHGQCMPDATCRTKCAFEVELPATACDKRPDNDGVSFQQHIGNNFWVKMPCAPGTAFNPVDCQCSLLLMNIPGKVRQQVCKPELFLPFEGTFDDRSGKNVFIHPENVSINNGAAVFNGRSRILINRYSNTDFRGNFVIKFRYKEVLQGPTAAQLQALITNGDCGSDPSIIIAKMPGYVLLGAKTDTPRSFALPTLDKEWKEVIYMHNEKTLEGRVCGASMDKWSYGPIQATHCAIQIGYGNGLANFMGYIDDLYIYQCRPRQSILSINY